MTGWRLVLTGLLVTLLLGALAAGLWNVRFREGKPLSWGEDGDRGGFAWPALFPGARLEWLSQLLFFLVLATLVLAVAAFVVAPGLRRRLLTLAISAGLSLFLLLEILDRMALERADVPVQPTAPGDLGNPLGGGAVPGPPAVPIWAIYLVAVALGGAVAFWLARRLPFSRRPRLAAEIQEVAEEAAADLKRGLPVADVVVRCWVQMVEILSRKAKAEDAPGLTPREFAAALARLGFQEDAIRKLTELFEEVRYGRKASEPRREEAIAALSAIERAYG
ncbi:DUF4129 domain-containing protein [Candidatus Bipolaricaulota bacterium]|nr:DUF4129 domain-containing protein [Candidatus Bipolaricaulota bacterium]